MQKRRRGRGRERPEATAQKSFRQGERRRGAWMTTEEGVGGALPRCLGLPQVEATAAIVPVAAAGKRKGGAGNRSRCNSTLPAGFSTMCGIIIKRRALFFSQAGAGFVCAMFRFGAGGLYCTGTVYVLLLYSGSAKLAWPHLAAERTILAKGDCAVCDPCVLSHAANTGVLKSRFA